MASSKVDVARFSSVLAERVRACRTVDELCEMVAVLCHDLLPGDMVVVSLHDPALDAITVRSIQGLGDLLDQAVGLLGSDPRRMAIRADEMTEAERRRYCSGRMERVEGGIWELLARRVPRQLCGAVERLLGLKDCWVVGFGLGDVPYGGLTVGRRHEGPPEERPLLELLSGLVSLAVRQRQAEQDRAALEQRLLKAQKLEAVGQLAGGVAHDFNNTLQCIRGLAELMRMDLEPGHPHVEQLDDLLAAVDHARDLTRSLLAVGSRQALQLVPMDLRDLVCGCRRLLDGVMRDAVVVECSAEDGPIIVAGDGRELKRAVLNLAINAQDAMPTGGRLSLSVAKDVERGLAVLEVADTGTGMSEEVRRRAFEPFFTTKTAEHGSGLGLATVDGTVRQHGGQITVSSTPGEGTCFRILLPLHVAEPGRAEPARPPAAVVRSTSSRGWVLVVDDDVAVRRLVARLLQRVGWRVLEAEGGEQALSLCEGEADGPAVALSDYSMPGMGGLALLAELVRRYPGLPTVVMSGFGYEVASDPAFADETSQPTFLAKPFANGELIELVDRLAGISPPQETG